MLGGSGILANSGDISAAAVASGEAREGGGNGGGGELSAAVGTSTIGGLLSEEERMRIEEGDRNSGGNRWPRQETLALLKIRSDMDVAFRDSSLKGPLWEEVSRKLAELGYNRSAKKCKEKFENVFKYHKRTKEGRVSKPDGKTYRFFDQLEALENQPPLPFMATTRPQTHQVTPASPVAVAMPAINLPFVTQVTVPTVPSTANPTTTVSQSTVAPIMNPTNPFPLNTLPQPPAAAAVPAMENISNLPQTAANFASMSSPSSTSSDEEPERRRKRKRKWEGYFQRLLRDVIEKQEEMQKRFLETLECRERHRVAREEAWRAQEMARMSREHDLLVQERSMAAAKDAAVITFLQKVSEQHIPNVAPALIQMKNHQILQGAPPPPPPPPPPPTPQPVQPSLQPPPQPQPQPQPKPQPTTLQPVPVSNNPRTDNGGENFLAPSSSRWPKAEVEALIRLRTNLDLKYQENGPKGPLWEEISAAMCKLGYNRNPKRCKEKWENINKYFKKVKESNKKRPEDSKTCPYFQQLDALYRAKTDSNFFNPPKPENPTMAPIMVQPEQQWPLPQEHNRRLEDDLGSDNYDDDDGEDQEEDDDEDEASGYEIVTNKPSSVGTAG